MLDPTTRALLDALAELRDRDVAVHCTIAGDGELRDALHAQARELGLGDAVSFRGHVAHAALLGEMRAGAYDAMVLTATKAWRYRPATLNGVPVKFRKTVQITIKLSS